MFASTETMVVHVNAMLALQQAGAWHSTTATTFAASPSTPGARMRFSFPALCPNIFARSSALGRAIPVVALSGDPRDIDRTDELALELFPENEILNRWLRLAHGRFAFRDCRAHLLAGLRRARADGEAMNDLVARVSFPRLWPLAATTSTPARWPALSRNRKMLDGFGRRGGLAHPEALLNTASGATWVSFHHGAAWAWATRCTQGRYRGRWHGDCARKIQRVLNNDPGLGVVRHAMQL